MADVSKIVPKDLDPNKEYVVRVRSVNPLGTKSEWSRGLYVDTSRTSSVAGLFNQTDKELSVLSRDGEVIFGTYAVEGIRNNLIANPSFETNMTGWTALSACTVASVSTEFVYGNNSAEITPAGGITSNEDIGLELEFSNYATVIEGNRYTLSLYVYREYDQGEHGGVNEEFSHVRLKANIYDLFNIKAVVEASEPIRIPNNKWTRLHIEDILIPTGYSASPRMGLTVQLDDSPGETVISVNEKLYVDAVLLEEATELDSYFDGDTVPGLTSWDATDHASTSTFNNPAAGSVFFRGSLTVGGVIRSDNYDHTSGDFSDSGTELELSTGRFRAPSFGIDDSGNAFFSGTITATNGTIGGWSINSGSLSKGNTVLTGSGTDGSIATTDFILKDGSATRGLWTTGLSLSTAGSQDGILVDSASGSVAAGLFWPTGGAGNSISLINRYTSGTGRVNSITADYNNVSLGCVESNSPFRFVGMKIDETSIEVTGGGSAATLTTTSSGLIRLPCDGTHTAITTNGSANPKYAITFHHNDVVVGTIWQNTTTTSYATTSDYRLKENVAPLTDGLSKVMALKPSEFNFVTEPGERVGGFIAHEADLVVPYSVNGEKDAVNDDGSIKPQVLDASKLIPVLTAAMQELTERVIALEN